MVRPKRSLADLRALTRNLSLIAAGRGDEERSSWVQELVERSEVTERAPADVRAAVDVAIEVHTYGMFSWRLFTVAILQASLTRELALGRRFIEFYGSHVPLAQRRDGVVTASETVDCGEVRALISRFRRDGSHPRNRGWMLAGHLAFNGSFRSLLLWARNEGLLRPWLDQMWARHSLRLKDAVFAYGVEQKPPVPARPQDFATWAPERQGRWFEEEFREGWELFLIEREVEHRNDAAHPTGQSVLMPTWSADEILSLSEFVNLLWPAI